MGMRIKPLGDSAWLVELPENTRLVEVLGLVAGLGKNRPPGVVDVVSSFVSVAVHFRGVDGWEILDWIQAAECMEQVVDSREWEIPVIYGGEAGPDLEAVAERCGESVASVVEQHAAAVYTVAALGFSPGFPYLSGLPESLQLGRRDTPRASVPAGSVAIAGAQAGIYPNASPAGWHVLGRTSVTLFDPRMNPPARLKPGDRVRFRPVEILPESSVTVRNEEWNGECWIEVIQPGGMTTVQDLGRSGYESSGVSPGGAVNRWALEVANVMVGNAPDAAALECCVSGPTLKFYRDCFVAMVGVTGKSRRVRAGEMVDFSKLDEGVRAYLAVAGGLRVPRLLGSAATDLRAGFGGRRLVAGDHLACYVPQSVPRPGGWSVGRLPSGSVVELRYLRGVQADWFTDEALRQFGNEKFTVMPQSDRMGARLCGPRLLLRQKREMISQPVACGSVQVPPDGQPIVLMAERQTLGGYPQIGHVISVDLPRLAQAWPGASVRFVEVTRDEAVALRQQAEADLAMLQNGIRLLPCDL
jgi:KipI family sensor histidine kinase inhibitor